MSIKYLNVLVNLPRRYRASLREQLLALSHEDFMSLIRKVYAAMEGGIHELQVQSSLQQDVLDDLQYVTILKWNLLPLNHQQYFLPLC